MKTTRLGPFWALVISTSLAMAADQSTKEENAECRQHLEKIHAAIQNYRKDNKELPPYLNALVPKYISDTNVFACPAGVRLGEDQPFPDLADPKIKSHYLYEFSAKPVGDLWNGGRITMAEWKGLQMSVLGGGVPILRCWMHDPVLNISFDGKVFESPQSWEELHTDKVNFEDLSPASLRARLLRSSGGAAVKNEDTAFEDLRDAAALRRGVVGGDDLSEEHKKWNEEVAAQAMRAVAKADEFLKEYPNSARRDEAEHIRIDMLVTAARAGDPTAQQYLQRNEEKARTDTSMDESERIRLITVSLYARKAKLSSADLEKELWRLVKDFPKRPEPYFILLNYAQEADETTLKKIANEVISNGDAPQEIQAQAKGILKKMSLMGQPLDLKFAALDGREVDLSKMKGKVVLIDFWATWCGPCVAELPNVKAAYDELHGQGFEIVGISFDQSKSALENFVKKEKMAWPQFFDGKGWQNQFGQEYGINSIPTMWLIGKDGTVADMNARGDLRGKVKKLLAD